MANTVVKISNLVKNYGTLTAVDHLDHEIKEGEIYGLLGPNGSGKTTTISCLLSLLSYDEGEIEIFGKKMSSTAYDIKKDIGVVLQNVAVFEQLNVYQNIDCFCSLYVKDKKKRQELVWEAIKFVGLEDFVKFYPKKLSGGLLRRLNIACGIVHKPKLIFFDEPTVAVDPQSRNNILDGILRLRDEGCTIIYTSHYMEEVEQICSRISIIDKGRKVAEGTKEQLKQLVHTTETILIEVEGLTNEGLQEIKSQGFVTGTEFDEHTLKIYCHSDGHCLLPVLNILEKHNVKTGGAYTKLPTLNDVFLEITGKELRDKEA